METKLDRFNRMHHFYQRQYNPCYRPVKKDPRGHGLRLISLRRKRRVIQESRLDTSGIRVSHKKLEALGELSVFAGWKHERGYQIQVLLHANEAKTFRGVPVLSSAKVGRSVQHSLERNYDSLLRLVDGREDIPTYLET